MNQDEQRNTRKAVKNARLKRIITSSEVILTPESIGSLQNLGAAPAIHNSDGNLHSFFINADTFDLIQLQDSRLLLAGGIPPGSDPWFLGGSSGLDPFSSLPHIDREPIPKKALIFHYKALISNEVIGVMKYF